MNTSLLALERGDGVERIAELFRAVHTVKGMSAAMGYDDVRNLSHALETLLDQLRRGQTMVTTGVIAVLFDAVDTLDASISALSRAGAVHVDVLPAIVALEGITPGETDGADGSNPTMEWPVVAPGMTQTDTFEIRSLSKTPPTPMTITASHPIPSQIEKAHRF